MTPIKSIDTTTTLQYLVRQPLVKSEHPPVLILLHGVGSNEADLFSFANQLPEKYLVVSVRAPFSLGGNRFAWYQVDFSSGKPVFNLQEEENSRAALITFILQIKEKYAVNSNEIYLCGFSQGAIMSYSIALTRPDLVKGIAILSGRLLPEITPLIVGDDRLKSLDIFISHGTQDQVLNFQYALDANVFLNSKGMKPKFHSYDEGHSISQQMLDDVVRWLSGNEK